MDIIFFTSNLNYKFGGLDLENREEIKIFKKNKKNILILDYNYLDNIVNILKYFDINTILYIDFTNQDLIKLNNLKNINNKIILKYKGYYLNDSIVSLISSYNDNEIIILTTSYNKNYKNIKFIKYWSLDINDITIRPYLFLIDNNQNYYLENFNSDNNNFELNNELFNKLLIDEKKQICNNDLFFKVSKLKYTCDFNNFINSNYKYTYMFVGRKEENKGIYKIINIFRNNKELLNNSRLIIIGYGSINFNHDKPSNIIEFPYLEYNHCIYMIKHFCNCLLLPSKNEGFGRVAIEALFYNKFVIITKYTLLYDFDKNKNSNIFYIENDDDIIKYMIKVQNLLFNNDFKNDILNEIQLHYNSFINYFN